MMPDPDAAAVLEMIRTLGRPPPATDFAMGTPPQRRFAERHLLTRASIAWFRD